MNTVPVTDPNAPGAVPGSLPSYGVYAPPPAYTGAVPGAPGYQQPYAYDPNHYTAYKAHKGMVSIYSRFLTLLRGQERQQGSQEGWKEGEEARKEAREEHLQGREAPS